MVQELDYPVVNRSVITVRLKQPYVNWANKVSEEDEGDDCLIATVESLNSDVSSGSTVLRFYGSTHSMVEVYPKPKTF